MALGGVIPHCDDTMKRLICFLALLSGLPATGATITAASSSRADVGTAYSSCVDGDVLLIPSGTSTWTSALAVNKAITIQGSGYSDNGTAADVTDDTWGTTLNHGITAGSKQMFKFSGAKTIRLKQIAMGDAGGTADTTLGSNYSDYNTIAVIEQCKFTNLPGTTWVPYGYGVMSKCLVALDGGRVINGKNGSVAGGSNGDTAWQDTARWGTEYFWFLEQNHITQNSAIPYGCVDGWEGMRIVVRYNTLVKTRISDHGTESAQRLRSGRAMEVYNNTFDNTANLSLDTYIDIRGGTALVHNNTITGRDLTDVKLNNYRLSTIFKPWGGADGTKAWDGADLSDGSGTPGGAGDGVFESGTPTGFAANKLSDSTKSWGSNAWAGYSLRATYTGTASSGGLGTLDVSGAGWTTNQWADWEITQVSTNAKGYVLSNDADTLTLDSGFHRPTFAASNQFVLSKGGLILSNTGTQLTTNVRFETPSDINYDGATGYEIRRVDWVLDGPGRGQTSAISGSPPNHQNLSQALEPIYIWNNTDNGGSVEVSNNASDQSVQLNRDYYLNAPSGYTAYTYPHPLRQDSSGTGGGTTTKQPGRTKGKRLFLR